MTKKRGLFWLILFILIISLPTLLGWLLQGSQLRFSGLILNPIDGYSYFAKMQQGAEGAWVFKLPFTAQPGTGVVLFEFYLFLGHISRISHLSIPLVFHLARIVCSIFLFTQILLYIKKYLNFNNLSTEQVLLFILFSSGMGWAALIAGYKSADFWIAEAYPFFSSLISPHFTFGMAIFLWVLNHVFEKQSIIRRLELFFLATLMCLAMPFASVILCIILALAWLVIPRWRNGMVFKQILFLATLSILFLGWQYWATLHHSQLSIWNQQNITLSPPLWDILIGFSPMMILAVASLRKGKEHWQQSGYQLSLIWFVSCLLLAVFPFSLQRRFLFSFSIPVTIMGLYELDKWMGSIKWGTRLKNVVFALPLVTIGMLYVIMAFSILQRSPYSYMTLAEVQAYSWIQNSPVIDKVILSDELHALKIPAMTGRQVFYGHPFETVNAVEKQNQLDALLSCQGFTTQSAAEFLREEQVNDVLIPREIYDKAICLQQLPVTRQNQEFIYMHVQD
jgi:hypothetical protein